MTTPRFLSIAATMLVLALARPALATGTQTLTCPGTFQASPTAVTLSLVLKNGTAVAKSVPVTWSTTYLSAANSSTTALSSSQTATGTTGTATTRFASTLAGPASVTVSWSAYSGIAAGSKSCPITVLPGPPSPQNSSLVIASTSTVGGPLYADGLAAAQITVTIEDAYNNPIPNEALTLTPSPAWGRVFLPAAEGKTGTNGTWLGTISAQQAGVTTVALKAGTYSTSASVTFTLTLPPVGNATMSCPSTYKAGSGSVTLSVVVTDTSGAPIPTEPIGWSGTANAKLTTTTTSAKTDITGTSKITFSATVTNPNTVIEVNVGGTADYVSCTFPVTNAAFSAAKSTLTVSPASPVVPGPATVTATAKDIYGNAYSDATIVITNTGTGELTPQQSSSGLTVTSASYGDNCAGVSTGNWTADVGAQCNGTDSCAFEVVPAPSDPAYGCQKSFAVDWTCGSKPYSGSLPADASYQTLTLTCPTGTLVESLASDQALPQDLSAAITVGGTTVTLTKSVTFEHGPASTGYVVYPDTLTGTSVPANGQVDVTADVCVTDAYGNPVPKVTVTFGAALATGASEASPPNSFKPASAVTGTDGCASTLWSSTTAFYTNEAGSPVNGGPEVIVWSVPGVSHVHDTQPVSFFTAEPAPATIVTKNTGNGSLTVYNANDTSVTSIPSDQPVTVVFSVWDTNGTNTHAPVVGVPCSFTAISTESRYADDVNQEVAPWNWNFGATFQPESCSNGCPSSQTCNGWTNLCEATSCTLNTDCPQAGDVCNSGFCTTTAATNATATFSGGTTDANGQCKVTLQPGPTAWSITVYAEATDVPLPKYNSPATSVVLSKALTVTNGTPQYISVWADSDFGPADGKTGVVIGTRVDDETGDPLSGVTVTFSATPEPWYYCYPSQQENSSGTLKFSSTSGKTTSPTVSNDATALEFNTEAGYVQTTVTAPVGKTGCYGIEARTGNAQGWVYIDFSSPVVSASITLDPPMVAANTPVQATVTVDSAPVFGQSDLGIPGQEIEFSAALLEAEGLVLQPNYNVYSCDTGNYCVITEYNGTAQVTLTPTRYSATPLPITALVHQGSAGSPDWPSDYNQDNPETGAPLAMPPVVAEPTADLIMLNWSGSSIAFAAGSPSTVVADGATTTTIVVTIADSNSNGVPGVPITISTTGYSEDTLVLPSPAVTDSLGTFTFTISSFEPQPTDKVTAVAGGDEWSGTLDVDFTQFQYNQALSSLTATTTANPPYGNGISTYLVKLTLYDGNNPMANMPVTFYGGPSGSVFAPDTNDGFPTFKTNTSGECWAYLTSTGGGQDAIYGTITGELATPLTYPVSFYSATLNVSGAATLDNGQSPVTLSTCIGSSYPGGIPGISVVYSVDGSTTFIGSNGASGVTDGTGCYTVTVTSAIAHTEQVSALVTDASNTSFTLSADVAFSASTLSGQPQPPGQGANNSITISMQLENGAGQPYVLWSANAVQLGSSEGLGCGLYGLTGQTTVSFICPGFSLDSAVTVPSWCGLNGDGFAASYDQNGNPGPNDSFCPNEFSNTPYDSNPGLAQWTISSSIPHSEVLSVYTAPSSWTATQSLVSTVVTFSNCYSTQNGLLAYYTFDQLDQSGNVPDLSGNGNPSAPLGSGNALTTGGVLGGGLSFGGTTGFAVPNVGPPDVGLSGARSLCAWENASGSPSLAQPIFSAIPPPQQPAPPQQPWAAELFAIAGATAPSGVAAGDLFFEDNGTVSVDSNISAQSSGWHQVCWTYDDSGHTVQTYVDGNVATPSITATLGNDAPSSIVVGGNAVDPTNAEAAFSGTIDEVGIWSRALTQTEVQNLYNQGVGGAACRPISPQPNSISVSPGSGVSVPSGEPVQLTASVYDLGGNPVLGATVSVTGNGAATISPATATIGAYGSVTFSVSSTNAETDTFVFTSGLVSTSVSVTFGCASGTNMCSGNVCSDPNTDPNNCGGCSGTGGTVCSGSTPFCSAGSCTACVPAPEGLVSWYKGEGNMNDELGVNPGQWGGGDQPGYSSGMVGSAFQFDGNSLISATTINVPVGSHDRTIEMWVNLSQAGNDVGFAGYGQPTYPSQVTDPVTSWIWSPMTSDWWAFNVGMNATVNSQLQEIAGVYVSSYGSSQSNGDEILTPGQWYHLAATSQNQVSTLYVNGSPVFSGPLTLDTQPGSWMYLGGVLCSNCRQLQGTIPGGYLNGLLDEVSVYNRALSATEINDIYSAGSAGKCAVPAAPASPPASCAAILSANNAATDGLYWIQPAGSSAPYQVWCDMQTDGGGWTMFYAGTNGWPSDFASFENQSSPYIYANSAFCPDPQGQCLRQIPSTETNPTIAAFCGSAGVAFTPGPNTLAYLQSGTEYGWEAVSNVTSIGTSPVNTANVTSFLSGMPSINNSNNADSITVYPGQGWILGNGVLGTGTQLGIEGATFADSYAGGVPCANSTPPTLSDQGPAVEGFDECYTDLWDQCNGVQDQTSPIRLMYR